MSWMERERSALVATARSADPDGPTLCEGWTTRHLIAHLVEREQRPLHAAADMASRRDPGDERFMSRLVERARSPAGYQALVDRFAHGPPKWSPLAWAGDRANLLEYVIHHEDIRRGDGGPAPTRELPDGQADAVWQHLTSAAKLILRGSPVGVVLQPPGHAPQVVRKGAEVVTVSGAPVELALQVFGRPAAADVELTGPPGAVAQFQGWAD